MLAQPAFDSLNHAILLKRPEVIFGIRGKAFNWFRSYLCSREQSVIVESIVSSPCPLEFGVLQGSVLGPLCVLIHCSLLSVPMVVITINMLMTRNHPKKVSPMQFLTAQTGTKTCTDDLLSWMNINKLKLDTDKAEIMPVTCKFNITPRLGWQWVCKHWQKQNSVQAVREVSRDSPTLSLQQHISSICLSNFLGIHKTASICPV